MDGERIDLLTRPRQGTSLVERSSPQSASSSLDRTALEQLARILAHATPRRGVLRGLGGGAAATAVAAMAAPRRAEAADLKHCRRREKRCRRRCRRRHNGGLFGCGFNCLRFCGDLID
jgi:hypothetical protein